MTHAQGLAAFACRHRVHKDSSIRIYSGIRWKNRADMSVAITIFLYRLYFFYINVFRRLESSQRRFPCWRRCAGLGSSARAYLTWPPSRPAPGWVIGSELWACWMRWGQTVSSQTSSENMMYCIALYRTVLYSSLQRTAFWTYHQGYRFWGRGYTPYRSWLR